MMDWVWVLYEKYIRKSLSRKDKGDPCDDDLQNAFIDALRDSYVTILVQEPWRGSVRFKTLQRLDSTSMFALFDEPLEYLAAHFGGGKFKLNFHHGFHFVATRNFKPDGEPLWMHIPELTE